MSELSPAPGALDWSWTFDGVEIFGVATWIAATVPGATFVCRFAYDDLGIWENNQVDSNCITLATVNESVNPEDHISCQGQIAFSDGAGNPISDWSETKTFNF